MLEAFVIDERVSEAKETMILSEEVAQIEAKLKSIPELPKGKEMGMSEDSPVKIRGIEPDLMLI
jgi:hypothetical protein